MLCSSQIDKFVLLLPPLNLCLLYLLISFWSQLKDPSLARRFVTTITKRLSSFSIHFLSPYSDVLSFKHLTVTWHYIYLTLPLGCMIQEQGFFLFKLQLLRMVPRTQAALKDWVSKCCWWNCWGQETNSHGCISTYLCLRVIQIWM